MKNSDGTVDEAMSNLIFITITNGLAFLLMLAALLIALKASHSLFKTNSIPWNRVILPCLLGSFVVHLSLSAIEYWFDWEIFVYSESVLLVLDQLLFLLIAIAFFKLVNSLNDNV